jgi:NAD(P)H dehydrogenase (quinone)
MILVTGATGQFGKATIDFLLKKGVQANSISVMVRDKTKAQHLKEQGINIRVGNYDDYNSLLEAFKGTDKLLLISGNDVINRSKQHENAVKAAQETGIKHIVYTSFIRKNETDSSPIAFVGKSHIQTDNLIKASGIPYTIMLNSIYSDMLPIFMGEKILETGVFFPAGDGKAAFTSRNDMAEAAAHLLSTPGHESKEYVIANTSNYSLHDVSNILSELTGKKIPYAKPSVAFYTETLTKNGVPSSYVSTFAGFGEAINQGEFEIHESDLEKLIGRKPTSLKDFFKTVYSVNNQSQATK